MYRKRALLAIISLLPVIIDARPGIFYMSPLAIGIVKLAERRQKQDNPKNEGPKSQVMNKDGDVIAVPEQEMIVGSLPHEVLDIIEFLRNPDQFRHFGAKMPKGVLFVGPPGTGKTSMARAIAREADAEFITAAGSEFVNMYVGVGAANVRKLFEKARNLLRTGKCKSVIIFIDEIDALGSRSETEGGGGTIEYNQTLNQLLTEMDGFKRDENILVIAATNREDVLDAALLRPGRFDRRAYFKLPEKDDRLAILKHYCKGRPVDQTVDLAAIAEKAYDMSGADLKNIVNEASIEAAREKGATLIAQRHFEVALQKAEQRRDVQRRRSFRR
jgi:cell division protease FtsH